jgi:hypothetical protein
MKLRVRSMSKLQMSILGLVAIALSSTLSMAQAPPHLLLSTADFTRLNELSRTQPWAAKQKQAIIDEAAAFPESYEKKFGLSSVELPPEGGQWFHYYACPDTGSQLVFHPPDQNVCPDTGQVFKGYPYDHVVYMQRADALEKAALTSALAYRLTGDHADADKAAQILKAYADKYLTYPIHDNYAKESQYGARVYSQTLDEAIWLIDLAWTYDLLRDTDVFTPADRTHIERDLLYAAVMTCVRANNGPTYNIQSWILGAEAAVGYTLKDKTLIDQAIDGLHGFRDQMKENVHDGFWIEGAWGYQFYALRPLEYMAQMSARAGVDLWKQEPNLAALLASPLGVMFPDGTLPAFNDSGPVNLYSEASRYEAAYSALKNPAFAAINEHAQRANREAFLFGVPSIVGASLPKPKSEVFPNAGYATLRAPASDLTEIIKFGPHGGGHGHLDKLNEVIYSKGGAMSVDPGSHLYGLPIHTTWDKMTVAHNTVSVDQTNQKQATGKLLSWQAETEFTAVTADAGSVYDNVDLQRTSILTSDYILEITSGNSTDGKEHDFDWNYHNSGVQHADANLASYAGFPQRDGYQNLTENQSAEVSGDLHSSFLMENDRAMNVWMLADGNKSQVFTGLAPGHNLKVKVPYVIVRRHGSSAKFIAVFEPGPSQAKIVKVTNTDGKIQIRTSKWEDTIDSGAKLTYHRVLLP